MSDLPKVAVWRDEVAKMWLFEIDGILAFSLNDIVADKFVGLVPSLINALRHYVDSHYSAETSDKS